MTQSTKTEYEKGLEVLTSLAKEFDARPASIGVSYFKGKNRLCKILNSKKGIRLELNVVVSGDLEKKYSMVKIDEETAKKKHLGSMKYMVVALKDTTELKEIVEAALVAFKATYETPVEPKPEETKPEAAQPQPTGVTEDKQPEKPETKVVPMPEAKTKVNLEKPAKPAKPENKAKGQQSK